MKIRDRELLSIMEQLWRHSDKYIPCLQFFRVPAIFEFASNENQRDLTRSLSGIFINKFTIHNKFIPNQ